MDLKTFVADSLVQLLEGVKDAQARMPGMVNPRLAHEQGDLLKSKIFTSQHGAPVRELEFDIAVTAGTENQIGGKVSVVAAWFGGGEVNGGLKEAGQTVSRLKFVIPVAMPRDETSPAR